ncbi:MAG: dual specificity protein phosphatase family protein [Victivallales bacterium]|jgi:protein tyrosine/serine phosphatase
MKNKIPIRIFLWFCGLVVIMIIMTGSYAETSLDTVRARNQEWAMPVPLEGVPNLHKITNAIYRSAQPEATGMKNLVKLDIKTVINLRSFHDDKDEVKSTGLHRVDVPIDTWNINDDQVIRVMKELAKSENGPFLIHCQHGADRTGLMSAMYRIIYQGWSKEKALDEMRNGGYGYHTLWANIISYIEKADIEKLKKEIQQIVEK